MSNKDLLTKEEVESARTNGFILDEFTNKCIREKL